MLYGYGLFGLVVLALWIFCIFDVITTPEYQMNHLPKLAWLLIVFLLPTIGSIVWLVVGRDRGTLQASSRTQSTGYPEYDRPGRAVAASPDDDEAFLRQVRERAERQRRDYEQRRRAELPGEQDAALRRRDREGDQG
jgi:hypothetical protein